VPLLTINTDRTAGEDFGGYDLTLYSDSIGAVSDWHKRTSGGYTTKSGGGNLITIAAIGPALTEYPDDPRTFTNGSTSLGNLGVYSGSTVGNGYRLTCPADTTKQELLIWVGCYSGTLSIAASLSDASATVSPNTQITDAAVDGEVGYVRIAFQAASGGQTLTVDVTLSASSGGNATYNASALRTASIGLDLYEAALAEVQAGTGNARIVVLGDSLTAGYQSSSTMAGNAIADSWPAELALQFTENPAVFTGYLGDNHATAEGSSPNAYNSKVVQGTGWSVNSLETIGGRMFLGGTTNGAAHAFTPGFAFTKFRVAYRRFSGSAEYTVNVNGGSSLGTLNMSDTVGGVFFEEFTASGDSSATINVVSNGTATGCILGIEAWNDASKAVHIVQAGVPGWTAGNWATVTNDYSPLWGVRATSANLFLLLIGTNDTTLSDRTNFRINLRRVIYGAKSRGSVMLIGFPYMGTFSGSPSEATQDLWRGDMAAVAAECGVEFIDPTDDTDWASYSAANTAGFMDADVVHLSDAGAVDWATQVLPHVDLAPPVVLAYARPDADISDGAWSPSTGSDLYACIDETPRSDTDFISVTSNSECEIGLGSMTTPDAGTQTFSYSAAGSAAKALIAGIYRGATLHEEWTVDPLPFAVTQYNRTIGTEITDTSDLRIRFETVDAASPPTATVTWGAVGTGASGTTSANPSYPTGIADATSWLIAVCTGRSDTATTAFSAPSGWTDQGQFEGGTGTFAADTGTRRVGFFTKDTVDGTESGTTGAFTFGTGGGNSTLRVTIHRVEVPTGYTLDLSFVSGADTTNGTGFSAAASSSQGYAPNDLLMIAVAQNIDTGTQSSQSITASGITFGTRTNRASTAVTNGFDHRHIVDTVPVSSGTGTTAPTYAYTISASGSGPVGFLRMRATAPTQFARVTWAEFSAPENTGGGTDLSVNGSSHGHAAENVVLTTEAVLAVQNAAHGHAVDNLVLSTSITLTVDGASHAQSAGASVLTTDSTLAVDGASHAHAAGAVVLTTDSTLAVANAAHGHTAENITLSTAATVDLVVADASHAHSAQASTLTTDATLVVANSAHAHEAGSPTLSVDISLAVADAAHAHTAGNVTLGTTGDINLTVSDAQHAHTAGNVALTTDSTLAVQSAAHAHAAESPTLGTEIAITVANAAHAHAAENVTLSQIPSLVVQDATHGHTAEAAALTIDTWLTVADAWHVQSAQNVTLEYISDEVPETYPLAGLTQEWPLEGQAQTYPLG
jgi:lysophospholipase L1-like esterase